MKNIRIKPDQDEEKNSKMRIMEQVDHLNAGTNITILCKTQFLVI